MPSAFNGFRLTGRVAATFTTFHDDGTLGLGTIEPYAALLVRNGVGGVFVCGSTSEGASMTTDERMRCFERWREVVTRAARGSTATAEWKRPTRKNPCA